jgi:glycerophosphoryl diester phosphodiesterase
MKLSLINKKPIIWAHRGGRSLAAENTLLALRKAHALGVAGWETDVQLTKDGEVIVLHDLNLMRTTNAGVHPLFKDNPPLLPWRFTLEEIKQLSADVFPRRFCPPKYAERPWLDVPQSVPADVQVPTLAEALRLTAEFGMWINVEIKDVAQAMPEHLAKEIVARVLDVIAAEGMEDHVIISSFNHDYVRECKERSPHIPTGALTPHKFSGNPVEMLKAVGADAWHPGYKKLTEDTVTTVREAGFAINPYTVNEVEDMKRLICWGVTGVVTDYPQNAPE